MILVLVESTLFAQQFLISAFQQNGTLTWTNAPGTNAFEVQWTPTLTGAWVSAVAPLDLTVSTGSETTVTVPHISPAGYYRVARGF